MPVNIYRAMPQGQKDEQIALLCEDEWFLSPQIAALREWLETSEAALPVADYVADVGFCWRRDAGSGGPVLAPTAMRRMADIGMSLFLSEYSGFADDDATEDGKARE